MNQANEPSWDVAREIASSAFKNLAPEVVSLDHAIGRVLGAPALSLCDLPAYETSAMDGWVLAAGGGPWEIVGEIVAGTVPAKKLLAGQAMKIATGGIIPSGGHSVLRWEHAREEAGFIIGQTSPGQDIRPAAQESKQGELLISAGTLLTPAMVGLLAACGHDSVLVGRKPRAAILLLGDELMFSGVPENGRVRDSLGIQIPAMLNDLGVEVISVAYLEDELESVINGFKKVINSVDILITTGGTADGPRDHIHAAIQSRNWKLLVDRVKVRPGHPMLLAVGKNDAGHSIPILGLPGNPQSAVVALLTLGLPLINSLLGKDIEPLQNVTTMEELVAPVGFNRLVAGRLEGSGFYPAQYLGSAMLRGLAHSTGFGVIEGGSTRSGASIRWLPLPQ